MGRAAFLAAQADGTVGIFTGDGGPIDTLALYGSSFDGVGLPDINESGTVAYTA